MMISEPLKPEKPIIDTPSRSLLTYYFLVSLFVGPFVLIVFPLNWIRFRTLRYELQDGGIRMSVGLLFRKEVIVAYRRIQDIHVSHNIIQRWLGISSVSIQTASGNAMPEIVVEGVETPDHLRDWLYERMRGAKSGSSDGSNANEQNNSDQSSNSDEVTTLLKGIRDNLSLVVKQASAPTRDSQSADRLHTNSSGPQSGDLS
ncbi:MAG: PH domain-containing protein [Pirellula sp.]|jgi:putative membrane protein|nr:PH domain-containing protein [Pirellula sp.]